MLNSMITLEHFSLYHSLQHFHSLFIMIFCSGFISLFFNFFLLQFYFCSSWLWLDDGNRTVESKREFEIWPGLRLRLIDWLYFDFFKE